MKYNLLGSTGVKVSSLCMGTMTFGGMSDEVMSQKVFDRCIDAGINFFDCANVYVKGESERLLGKFISNSRDKVFITSKAYFSTGPDVNAGGASRYHLVRAVEESLSRLDTDYIDLYFIHRFDDLTPLEETLSTLNDLVRQGKILYCGASNYAAWQVAKALGISEKQGWAKFSCIQPMYNLVKRQAEVELLPMAASEEIGVISYSPLGGGLLTGKYGRALRPESGRLMENDMYKRRYEEQWVYEAAEQFTSLAKDNGYHPVSLAIAWVQANPAITAPIIGARNLEQLGPCLDAAKISLSPEDELYRKISALTPSPPPATDRNDENVASNYSARK